MATLEQLLQNYRIFLCDDDAITIDTMTYLLRQAGAKVFTSRTQTHNILKKCLESLPISLILLDRDLGIHQTGYTIFKEIRNNPQLAHIPVVLITGADPQFEIKQAQQSGIDGFIAKPVRVKTFAPMIYDIIQGKSVWYDGSL